MGSRRNSGDTAHTSGWERQREQLSALLDGELSGADRVALERHLPGCPECQAELAQLRRVRVLLRALPAPAAPRSFVLTGGGTPPTVAGDDTAVGGRHSASAATLYRASRWVGGIAASLGAVLLLGSGIVGLLSSASHIGTMSSAAAPALGGRSTSAAAAAPTSPQGTGTQSTTAPNAAAPTVSPVTMPATTVAPPATAEEGPPLVPLAGTGLLAGGVIVLVVGSTVRPRRRAQG